MMKMNPAGSEENIPQGFQAVLGNLCIGFYAGVATAWLMALGEVVRALVFAEAAMPKGTLGEYFVLSLFGSLFFFTPFGLVLGLGLAVLSGGAPLSVRFRAFGNRLFGKKREVEWPAWVYTLLLAFGGMALVHMRLTKKMFTDFNNKELAGQVLNLIEYGLLVFGVLAAVVLRRAVRPLFRGFSAITAKLPNALFSLAWILPLVVGGLTAAVVVLTGSLKALQEEERNVIYAGAVALALLLLLIPVMTYLPGRLLRRIPDAESRRYVFRFGRPAFAGGTLLLFFLLSFMVAGSHGAIAYAVNSSPLVGRLLLMLPAYTDFDADRYGAFANGIDPDGFDHWRTPVGREIPNNGRDDNGLLGDGVERVPETDWPSFGVPESLKGTDFNIAVITFDAVRADHLGCYGYKRKTSPNLDGYAERGTVFERAYSVGTGTMISIPTLFTGRYVSTLQCDNLTKGGLHHRTVAAEETLQEYLREKGFLTAGFYNTDYMNIVGQGWDIWKVPKNKKASVKNATSEETTEEGLDFLKRHGDRRFFAWFHYYDPHDHYIRHAGIRSFGKSKKDLYDGEIAFADKHMGRLLDAIKHLDRPTVIFVSADHGESLGEHGIAYHNLNFYDAIVHVPLILLFPGKSAARVASPVSLVDIFPTVRDLLGDDPDPRLPGRSLLPYAMDGREDPEREIYHAAQFNQYGVYYSRRGLTKGRYRFFWDVVTGGEELYDIETDPKEAENRVGSLSGVAADMRYRLRRQVEDIALRMPPVDACTYRPTQGNRVVVNPEYVAERTFRKLPDDFEKREIDFGGRIRLRGVRADGKRLGKKSSVVLDLAFEAIKPMKKDYEIVLQLRGRGKNGVLKDLDHFPLRGHHPTPAWRPGEIYADPISFDLTDTKDFDTLELFLGWRHKKRPLDIKPGQADRVVKGNLARILSFTVDK